MPLRSLGVPLGEQTPYSAQHCAIAPIGILHYPHPKGVS